MDCSTGQSQAPWPFACALPRATNCGSFFDGDKCDTRPATDSCTAESFSFLRTSCDNLKEEQLQTWFFGGSGIILSREAIRQTYDRVERSYQLEDLGHKRIQQGDAAINELLYDSGLFPTVPSITDCSHEKLSVHVKQRTAPSEFSCVFGGTDLQAAFRAAESTLKNNSTCDQYQECSKLKKKVSIHLRSRGDRAHLARVTEEMRTALKIISQVIDEA